MATTETMELDGTIASIGFAAGDRFVVGAWKASPVGPLVDVMWATPEGRRTLLAPSEVAAAFITSVYDFDEVRVTPIQASSSPSALTVHTERLELDLRAGRGLALPVVRPAWVTRWVEGPIARALMGVRTYGVSPTGVEEWYRATSWRPVRCGRGSLEGRSLGQMVGFDSEVGFGFSNPPRRPSIVGVRPLLRARRGTIEVPERTMT